MNKTFYTPEIPAWLVRFLWVALFIPVNIVMFVCIITLAISAFVYYALMLIPHYIATGFPPGISISIPVYFAVEDSFSREGGRLYLETRHLGAGEVFAIFFIISVLGSYIGMNLMLLERIMP